MESVTVCVCAVKRKQLEQSTPNLVHRYSMSGPWHTMTQRSEGLRSRSHGYEKCHGRPAANEK